MVIKSDKSIDECLFNKINVFFALTSLKLVLMRIYFLLMNSKWCTMGNSCYIPSCVFASQYSDFVTNLC